MPDDIIILAPSFKKYWYLIGLTIFLSLFAAVLEGTSIGLLIPFLQTLSDSSSAGFETGWPWFDRVFLGVDVPVMVRLFRICGVILVATWLRAGFGYLSSIFGMESQVLVLEDLRMRILDQLQEVSLQFYSKTRSGEILSSLTNELARVGASLQFFVTIFKQGFLLLVYVAVMVLISWEITLVVAVFFGFLSLGLTRLIGLVRASGEKITRANGQLTSSIVELISGIRTIVSFNKQAYERDRLFRASRQLSEAFIETSKRMIMVEPLSQAVVSTVLISVVLGVTYFYVLPGKFDVALLLTLLFALVRLMPIVHTLNAQRGQWASLRPAITNVANVLRTDDKPYLEDGTKPVGLFREALVFENVSFAYEPGEPVLRHLNFSIECGKTTAIVGASGAGKTTLVDLVPRFCDPTEGRILLDGVDLRAFSLGSLRQKISMVSQDTYIFNETVRANIAYGAEDARIERIMEAAEQANALEFIQEMPEGFDTVLGDRGVRLSGGQRQRIAIARALLCDPNILILDEATSALDTISEKLVQQSLELLMKGRTVIAIAHRLSTIENADNIMVLEDGKLVEHGTYQELLMRRGQLWRYHSLQFQLA